MEYIQICHARFLGTQLGFGSAFKEFRCGPQEMAPIITVKISHLY